MKDPRERFTAVADEYDRFRPSYPGELVAWLMKRSGLAPGARVADVGCGTGISSRLLAAHQTAVVGIDPNEAMLEKARARGGGPTYRRGEAHATGLPDASVDLACAAQAFHWFAVEATLAEWRRIGTENAWGAAFWNLRDNEAPVMREYEAILARYSEEYQDRPRARQETIPTLRAVNREHELHEAEFPNVERLTLEALLGRAASASYVAHGVSDRGALHKALVALFERHQSRGTIPFPYRTAVIAWRLRLPTKLG